MPPSQTLFSSPKQEASNRAEREENMEVDYELVV